MARWVSRLLAALGLGRQKAEADVSSDPATAETRGEESGTRRDAQE